jgi:predicted XRE-type DNA-binding protein
MQYERQHLDRSTGQLIDTREEWLMVTEIGERYGVGSRRTRAILHHMGLLQREGGRYRLTEQAVKKDLGFRHDKTKSGRPFDVISPKGQALIAEVWDSTVADFEADLARNSSATEAREALDKYKANTLGPMTTQMEVCWLLDHFRRLSHDDIAELLGITQPLVSRYATTQTKHRAFYIGQQVTADEDTSSRRPLTDCYEVARTLAFYTDTKPCPSGCRCGSHVEALKRETERAVEWDRKLMTEHRGFMAEAA